MKFLYFLEDIRNPVFDFFFSAITHIGEETVFLALAILFFWCIDKREGYYILITGLVGTAINQVMKLAFRVPRPWIKDPTFTIVESARAEATGYSFPSGHTQNVTGTFGCIGRYSGRLSVRITAVVIILLVALSRMYLGVHTPLDVGVSLLIGTALTFLLYPLFDTEEHFDKFMPFVVAGCGVIALGFLLFVLLLPDKASLDPHNLNSGMKNAFTLFGCMIGLVAVYFTDRCFIRFETKAPWYSQVIKLIVGFAVVLGIKSGLSAPLVALFGNEYIARAVRYFLIVAFAGILWPMSFSYFAGLRIPVLDKFGEKVASVFKK